MLNQEVYATTLSKWTIKVWIMTISAYLIVQQNSVG